MTLTILKLARQRPIARVTQRWNQLVSRLPLATLARTGIANFAIALLGGVASIATARLLGPAGRGDVAAAFVWTFALCTVSQVGLPQALSYFSASSPAAASAFLRRASRSLLWQCLVVIPAAVVYLLHNKQIAAGTRDCILIALPGIAFVTLSTYAHSVALGRGLYSIFNRIRLLSAVGYFVAVAMAVALQRPTARLIVAASTTVQGMVAYYAVQAIRTGALPARPLSSEQKRQFTHYSQRACLSNLSSMANLRIDQFIISLVLTSSDLGVYAVAVSYASLLSPIAAAVANISLSMVARHGVESEHYSSRDALVSVCVVTLVPALVLFWAAPLVIPAMFGQRFDASITPARILSLGAIPLGTAYVVGDIIRGSGRPEYVAAAECIGLMVTMVGLWLFLPRAGILAASWVSLVSYTTVLLASSLCYWKLKATP